MRTWIAVLLAIGLVLGACSRGTAEQQPSPSPSPATTVEVEVYFTNASMGDVCTEVFPLSRDVAAGDVVRHALEALIAGPTEEEAEAGYGGWFSRETAGLLADVTVEDGLALVSFDRSLRQVIPDASSSCGSSALLAQLDRTLTQFREVDEAWYSLAGDRAAFYHWLQLAAPDDPAPPPPAPEPSDTVPPTPEPKPEPRPEPEPEPKPEPAPPSSSRTMPSSLIGTEWSTLPVSSKVVALTFDAGANADGVPAIMATLDAEGVPATFFLTGKWVAAYPAYSQQIGARYPVGNHTQTHPDLTTLSDAEARSEITQAQQAIRAATGRDPQPWFRFPFGARDVRTIGIANDLGYGSVRWSVDTLGWKGTSGGMTSGTVVQRVMDDLRSGQIVLMHVGSHPTDGSTLDADALPEVIRRIRAAGYRFVDLDSMLR